MSSQLETPSILRPGIRVRNGGLGFDKSIPRPPFLTRGQEDFYSKTI